MLTILKNMLQAYPSPRGIILNKQIGQIYGGFELQEKSRQSSIKIPSSRSLARTVALTGCLHILLFIACVTQSNAQQHDAGENAVRALNDIFQRSEYLAGLTAESAVIVRAGEEVYVPELSEEIKAGATMRINAGRDVTVVQPEESSWIKMDYDILPRYSKEKLDYVDLFYSEIVEIEPNLLVGVQYVRPKGTGDHVSDSYLTVASKGAVNLQLPPYYRGSLVIPFEEGVILKRVPGTKKMKVLKGGAVVGQITSNKEVIDVSSAEQRKIVFGLRTSTKNLTYKGKKQTTIAIKELREITTVEKVPELPADMGRGITNNYNSAGASIKIGNKSVIRLDIRNSEGERLKSSEKYNPGEHTKYFDAMYPETIEIGPGTIIPLEWKMTVTSEKEPLLVDAQITVTGGDVRFYYLPDMQGRAIVSGPKGATLKRLPDADEPRQIKVIAGSAYIGNIAKVERKE